jgi:hypothetical protein
MTGALEIDCAQVVVEVLTTASIGRICTETPDKIEDVLPVIQVIRVGGGDDGYILDEPLIVLHAYVPKDPAGPHVANQLLLTALARLRAARGTVVVLPDGARAVMTRQLDKLSGPSPAIHANPALRHAVMTIRPRIKTAV